MFTMFYNKIYNIICSDFFMLKINKKNKIYL